MKHFNEMKCVFALYFLFFYNYLIGGWVDVLCALLWIWFQSNMQLCNFISSTVQCLYYVVGVPGTCMCQKYWLKNKSSLSLAFNIMFVFKVVCTTVKTAQQCGKQSMFTLFGKFFFACNLIIVKQSERSQAHKHYIQMLVILVTSCTYFNAQH